MKKTFLALLLSLVTFTWASAQSPRVTAESKDVSIAYGQPSKKGRVILGKEGSQSLDKYDVIWRIGANKATEITFKKDGKFGGKDVKAGTYSFFLIPSETEWKIILNSSLEQWGVYKYNEIKGNDVLNITVPAKKYPKSEEKLTFKVSDTALDFQWDKEGFSVPLKF